MGFFLTYVPPPQIVVVVQDSGGIVSRYEDMVAKYISEGRRIEIRGMCSSACTLVLTSPNACVAKNGEAAWHQAFDSETHDVLPQVTKRMIEKLPPRLREYLDGRIQRDYTPATILGYEQLTALGVKSCDEPAEQFITKPAVNKPPAIMTEAFYAGVTKKVSIQTDEEFPASGKPDKIAEWNSYWAWAERQSKAQFGGVSRDKQCFDAGVCAHMVYYYDKSGRYSEAVEHRRGSTVVDRMVCRSASPTSPTMTCVGWVDGEVLKYRQSGNAFVQASR